MIPNHLIASAGLHESVAAVVYSTNITNGLSAPTLNGQNLSLSISNGGVTVTSNGGSANVVGTDYIA